MPLIWPSQRIAAAIADGTIVTGAPPDADQVQPASLDLRLGPKAYRLPASFLPGPGRSVASRLADLSTHEVDLASMKCFLVHDERKISVLASKQ